MNPTMGQFIDQRLDDVQRDRLLTAAEYTDGRWWVGSGIRWCGCLVTTAQGMKEGELRTEQCRAADRVLLFNRDNMPWRETPAAWRYARAVARFGKDRVVRAIKLRAAAAMSADYERAPEAACATS